MISSPWLIVQQLVMANVSVTITRWKKMASMHEKDHRSLDIAARVCVISSQLACVIS